MTIFGSDYETPDDTCIRDYTHVTDLAEAHVLALHSTEERSSGAYDLGNGRGFSVREVIFSVREVIDATERVTSLKVPFIFSDRRAGDPPTLVSSAPRARDVLGWKPAICKLDEIVRSAWAWHRRALS